MESRPHHRLSETVVHFTSCRAENTANAISNTFFFFYSCKGCWLCLTTKQKVLLANTLSVPYLRAEEVSCKEILPTPTNFSSIIQKDTKTFKKAEVVKSNSAGLQNTSHKATGSPAKPYASRWGGLSSCEYLL